jgi:hypothetical protein
MPKTTDKDPKTQDLRIFDMTWPDVKEMQIRGDNFGY